MQCQHAETQREREIPTKRQRQTEACLLPRPKDPSQFDLLIAHTIKYNIEGASALLNFDRFLLLISPWGAVP